MEASPAGSRLESKDPWWSRPALSEARHVLKSKEFVPTLPLRPSRSVNKSRRSTNKRRLNGRPWSPSISEKPSWRANRHAAGIMRLEAARTKDWEADAARRRATGRDRTTSSTERRLPEPAALSRRTNHRRRTNGPNALAHHHSAKSCTVPIRCRGRSIRRL